HDAGHRVAAGRRDRAPGAAGGPTVGSAGAHPGPGAGPPPAPPPTAPPRRPAPPSFASPTVTRPLAPPLRAAGRLLLRAAEVCGVPTGRLTRRLALAGEPGGPALAAGQKLPGGLGRVGV